ncbi:MAG: DEAD/DEAH box helicase, partial [Bifidobacterium sp.]|nr:DEAD/DEAH box helicase [Bifidobacterium sp.]
MGRMTDITVDTPLSSILTNKRRLGALKALGVLTVADALTYYPFRVTDPVPVRALSNVAFGEKMACAVTVRNVRVSPMSARAGYRLEVLVTDPHGSFASLVFFSHRKSYVDWMAGRLTPGLTIVIAGEPSMFNDRLQFTHPEVLTVAPQPAPDAAGQGALAFDDPRGAAPANAGPNLKYDVDSVERGLARVCRPRPVYHATSRISSEHIHETILTLIYLLAGRSYAAGEDQPPAHASLFAADPAARRALLKKIPDVLPDDVRAEDRLMRRAQAFCAIHEPDSVRDFREAIRTMRFEEAFVCQAALLMARASASAGEAYACADTAMRDDYIEHLPFQLTKGQRDVIDSIGEDMARTHPMQRLLQGEVGSGKTVVAVAAMLQAVGSGYQAVLVAPTQVLAEQH